MARYCHDWKPEDWPSAPRKRVYSLGVIVRSTSQALFNCSKMRATRVSILKAGRTSSARIASIAPDISWMASFIHSSEVWCWMMNRSSSGEVDSGVWASRILSRWR
jgi:hypothetical protein